MGSHTCGIVEESQSVLAMIDPIIVALTGMNGGQTAQLEPAEALLVRLLRRRRLRKHMHTGAGGDQLATQK
jgi:hypothetical protein